MFRIAIRTSGCGGYGWGHISRTRTLAGCLDVAYPDSKIELLIEGYDWITDSLNSEGFFCHTLKKGISLKQEKHWLEACETTWDLFIVDLLDLEEERVNLWRQYTKKLVLFRDMSEDMENCDILIWPQYLKSCSGQSPRILCGPAYFVIDNKFRQYRQRDKTIPPVAQKLLISMGGESQAWVLEKLSLMLTGITPDWDEIVWILGTRCPEELQHRLSRALPAVKFLSFVDNMPDYLYGADLALIGGGFVKYEAACCGTPSVILSLFDHQNNLGKQFADTEAGVYAGTISEQSSKKLGSLLRDIQHDRQRRNVMSARGKELVDGRGADRIVHILGDLL